jgi:DNA-binding NtrC family response regulator
MIIGNILIIDDEEINSETIKDTLEDVNYNVVLSRNAEQAKILIKEQDFDLIMMDVWMPGQDGMSLLAEWMEAGISIPIVMMSGHAEHVDVVRSIKLGATDFLKKPLHDILPLVRKILSEKITNTNSKINGINFHLPLKSARDLFEIEYFKYHLKNNNNNIAKVAELADLEKTTLYRKLKNLGLK